MARVLGEPPFVLGWDVSGVVERTGFAVQFAKHVGAYVIGTASRRHHDWPTRLGVDELIEYTAVRFEDAVGDVDVVIDLIGLVLRVIP